MLFVFLSVIPSWVVLPFPVAAGINFVVFLCFHLSCVCSFVFLFVVQSEINLPPLVASDFGFIVRCSSSVICGFVDRCWVFGFYFVCFGRFSRPVRLVCVPVFYLCLAFFSVFVMFFVLVLVC